MKRALILLAALLLILACGRTAPTVTGTPIISETSSGANLQSPTLNSQPPTTHQLSSFAFGVEYAVPGLAQIYAQSGAQSTRAAAETFGWDQVEPRAPVSGQRQYDWAKVDRYISEYQAAGFNQIQIYTTAFNHWASAKLKHYFPDAQYLADYENYIYSLVERYDSDGQDDAPGLKYPVLDYVIERE